MQLLVFALVSAAFTSVYIPQPVLPVLEAEFAISPAAASLTLSAVIAGIALTSLPAGWLADRYPIRRLILFGGIATAGCCLGVALAGSFPVLIGLRLLQGMFLPALTTCVAAYLARNLDPWRLNVAMGTYVSATVAGGLGGRLLGGWMHPPLHWRYAFVTTAVLILGSTIAAVRGLPPEKAPHGLNRAELGYVALVRTPRLQAIFLAAAAAFCVFSSVLTFFPFYLAAPPIGLSTNLITALYLTYVVGIGIGPIAGRISNRLGSGTTMALAAGVFAVSLLGTLVPRVPVLVGCLLGVCAGFFAVHAAAVGTLNRQLATSRGRANALYVLFYYLGGAFGIATSGELYTRYGWAGVVAFNVAVLVVPLATGLAQRRAARARMDA